jgi:hypothetical protein
MNAAQSAVLRRLAEATSWVSREDLARGLDWSEQRVDDELADLVVTGSALYNGRGREYRLGGTALARSALRKLLQDPTCNHALQGRPDKDAPVMRMGYAKRATDYSGGELLVMCELEMPYQAKDPDDVQRLVQALAKWPAAQRNAA